MRHSFRVWGSAMLCAALLGPGLSIGAEPEAPPVSVTATNSEEALRSYIQLQEQLHAAQLAIERARQDSDVVATRNAEAIAARLQAFQDTLTAQREAELKELRGANRLMLIVGGACAGVGFLAMLFTAYFQWRAISRLTEFSVVSQASLTVGRAALPGPVGEGGNAVEQAASKMFGTLEKLERRIHELEHTTDTATVERPTTHTGNSEAPAPLSDAGERVNALVAKGQTLLSGDKTEDALAVFDEILAIDPQHTDTLVKKGEALERLRRSEEAIVCYDQAIAADHSMTIAYLHKGGLFNRMERYEEALKCYEQALRTQEKSQAA